jgi:integrase
VADLLGREPEPDRFSFSPTLGDKPWNPVTVSSWFGRMRASAGVGPIRMHNLRHFSVTYLLDARIPVRTVADGHARTSMTLDRYAHVLRALDQAAAEVMGQLGIEAPH